MLFIPIACLLLVVIVGAASADPTAAQDLISTFHLTGIGASIIGLVLGGGIIGGIFSKVIGPIKAAKDTITDLTKLIRDLRANLVNDQDKADFNATIDDICTDMSYIKILKSHIPALQALKIKVDLLTPAAASKVGS